MKHVSFKCDICNEYIPYSEQLHEEDAEDRSHGLGIRCGPKHMLVVVFAEKGGSKISDICRKCAWKILDHVNPMTGEKLP